MKPAMTVSEEDARQDNTNIPQDISIGTSRSITRLKASQTPRGVIESAVQEKACYTTKEFNELANPFKQTSGEMCGNGF